MTFRTAFFSTAKPALCALALAMSLIACSPQPSGEQDAVNLQAHNKAQQIQSLLQQLQKSAGNKRLNLQLTLVELLLEEQQRDLASQTLEELQTQQLNNQQYIRYSELLCQLYLQRGLYEQALTALDRERLVTLSDQFSIEQQLSFTHLRAKVLALLGSHLASAQQRIYIDPLLDSSTQISNRKSIWRSLMYVPTDELIRYESTAFGEEYKGWLSLALIVKTAQGDLDEQVRRLDQWQQHWPNHPANQPLPEDLALIRELAANQAKQIALLLPLSGSLAAYGQAIRDGFMAAHYQAMQQRSSAPVIKIYDSASSNNFAELYQQTVNAGAEVVIGPLDKAHVRQLFDEAINTPTLALNRIDDYGQPPEQLFQFGLAPEDEALQIAELAFLENRRNALIISPRSSWGEKVSAAFEQHWQQLGAQTLGNSQFSGQQDLSGSIKDALYLQHSESRARRIQQLVGQHIEFEPRRRQDIDMIFLLAHPEQARSIKPLLNYHYAGDLPIYATSRIYSGYQDRKKDSDINGIKFTDIPWVLNPDTPLKHIINSELENSKLYQRMYALGVDSYQLYPRLKQLQHIPDSRVYGQTGTLKLNASNQIERTVLLAKFTGGRAKIIAAADQSLNQAATAPSNKSEQRRGAIDTRSIGDYTAQ
ncbi:penicillin-binding protein activator [Dasania sp. GY-MA-18]|uniref:Penicillin-binding protein activator n=1 Tax=Dasania phycosphaerae TaxID=2950436 RepID=A0A9J6RPU5_9GAMM|nr:MULTISPECIES: penicillin-binding protein activator [Dasania]MCR8923701.1 penicillin-binding protein activator [Dasania sp. GY-MA-18]MCZ0866135.1 penicillin-binding protein activator [Dasania phycosphaerae]MCZ0869859.1 penicillin-binding protein activator [Dasania phycosphaerae]